MRRFLAVTTTAMALVLGASAAQAQDKGGLYMSTTANGDQMIMGGDMAEGARVLEGSNGAAPSECPAGSFYRASETTVVACEGGTVYTLSEPGEGMMMSDGNPYPEGSMLLSAGDDDDVDTGAVPSGTIGQGSGSDDTGTRNDSDSNDGNAGSSDNDNTGAGGDGDSNSGSSDNDNSAGGNN
jgi:hypothetical protein